MSDELTDTQVEEQVEESEPKAPAPDPLETALSERDAYLDLAQRVQADFENYRKRAAREQERLVAHAHERLVRELLPILDDLERALEAAETIDEIRVEARPGVCASARARVQAGRLCCRAAARGAA